MPNGWCKYIFLDQIHIPVHSNFYHLKSSISSITDVIFNEFILNTIYVIHVSIFIYSKQSICQWLLTNMSNTIPNFDWLNTSNLSMNFYNHLTACNAIYLSIERFKWSYSKRTPWEMKGCVRLVNVCSSSHYN